LSAAEASPPHFKRDDDCHGRDHPSLPQEKVGHSPSDISPTQTAAPAEKKYHGGYLL